MAQAPGEATPSYAARWSITVPSNALEGLNELYLQVRYQGDVARFSAGSKLLADNFYNGQPWSIGLSRFIGSRGSNSFELDLLPLRKDAPVYFELTRELAFGPEEPIATLDDLRLVPEYQLILTDDSL